MLRTWWVRALAGALAAVAVWRAVDLIVDAVTPGYSPTSHALRAVLTSTATVAATAAYLHWQGLTWASLGAGRVGAGGHAGAGAVSFLLPAGLGIAAVLSAGVGAVHLGAPGQVLRDVALLVVLVVLFEALPEELIYRGWIYAALAHRLRPAAVVAVQALAFCAVGAAIGAATSPDRLLLFALFALVQGAIRAATGGVWACIGFHTAFQVVAQGLTGAQRAGLVLVDPDELVLTVGGLAAFVTAPWLAALATRRITPA